MSTMTEARLPPQPACLFNDTPDSILKEARRLVENGRLVQDSVVSRVSPESATFANVVLPLVLEENERLRGQQFLTFYANVSTDEKVRTASNEASQIFGTFDSESKMRRDLFELVSAVSGNGETIVGESRRLIDKMLLDFRLNGLGLSEEGRKRFQQLQLELRQVQGEINKNSSESTAHMWLTKDELDGTSNDIINDFEPGCGANEGKVKLPLELMQYLSMMRSVSSSGTRRRIYIAYAKSFEGNLAHLHRLLVLRDEKARLLGYQNHAEVALADNMEKSPQKVNDLLQDLVDRLAPMTQADITKARDMKAEDLKSSGEVDDGKFYIWDRRYYVGKLDSSSGRSETTIKDYFPAIETIEGMLRVFAEVFSMSFVLFEKADRDRLAQAAGGEALTWHEDVRLYAVYNARRSSGEQEDFLGYLYMDMHPRHGKMKGFADLPVLPGFFDAEGKQHYTATALVCNFPQPTKTKPSLLSHSNVVLLFHELGHGIHDLVAKTQYARFYGASTASDFNEAPSQMLENWCWNADILRKMGRHYSALSPEYLQVWRDEHKTSAAEKVPTLLPNEMIDELVQNKRSEHVRRCVYLAAMSIFDMSLNQPASHEDAASLDSSRMWHSLLEKIYGLDSADEDLGPAHLEQGVRSNANMHCYLLSEVYALDIFSTAFKANPLDAEQGWRYRQSVIGKGSSEDELDMLTAFLGRAPSATPFYEEIGLA